MSVAPADAPPTLSRTADRAARPGLRRIAARAWAICLHPSLPLLWITLLGAILRFAFLSKPALWGDEAATYMRICGSFQELLDELAIAGFGPLHYLAYWWLKQHFIMTPFMMRLIPAIAGTLMVPAMYWLAIQLVPRRTALLAALFTATSAYMLRYSRDAKMYAELWLFIVLNVASFLWSMRSRSAIGFWAWIASGVAMVGTQLLSTALLPIELFILLTSRNLHWRSFALPYTFIRERRLHWRERLYGYHWPPLLLFLVGVAIILFGPWIYYSKFNAYFRGVNDITTSHRSWTMTGIGWVEEYNEGRDGPSLVGYTASAFATAWEWPRADWQPRVDPTALPWMKRAVLALAAIAALGALPWRSFARRGLQAPEVHPGLRAMLWLWVWLIVPGYVVYCVSAHDAYWPMDWIGAATLRNYSQVDWTAALSSAGAFVRQVHFPNVYVWQIVLVVIAAAAWVAFLPLPVKDKWRRAMLVGQMIGLLLALCLLARIGIRKPFPGSAWMPRYLGFTWPAFAIVGAILIMRLPTRPIRLLAILILVSINLTNHAARIFAGSEPPTDLMARDAIAAKSSTDTRMFYRFGYRGAGDPGSGLMQTPPGRYYLSIYSGKPVAVNQMKFFSRGFDEQFGIWFAQSFLPFDPLVAEVLKKSPNVKRIIVWQQAELRPKTPPKNTLAERLGPEWKLVEETPFTIRDHWTWRELFAATRRVYVRNPSPPTTHPRG